MNIEQQLHDLTGALPDGISEAVALGTGIADGYDFYESAVGTVVVTFNPNGVSSLSLASDDYEGYFAQRHGRQLIRAQAPNAWSGHIPAAIEAGTPGRLPVDLSSVTPFQTRILRIAATIPKGEVRPYGWLAREADRAVGSTMARNPIPLIIPCHRVVRSDGTIGAYSLGGPEIKWELLTHEGADPEHLENLAEHQVRVQGNVSTHIFCHPTCRAIRRSKPGNVVDFRSGRAAMEAGFRACELCRP
jgi:methylated-DNA-[protein]-cysteine S-methyltransferase